MPRRHKATNQPRGQFLQSCESKRRYSSKKDCEDAVEIAALQRMVELDVYNCSLCGGWHLTSRKTSTDNSV